MSGFGIAYLITNMVSGKAYVGITRREPLARWGEHIRKARSKSRQPLQKAIASYGSAVFRFEVIASAISKDALHDLERILVTQHGTLTKQNGYNCSPGGEAGFKSDTDALLRISQKAKRRWLDPEYRAHLTAAIGASRTPEFKTRASIAQAEVWKRPEYRAQYKSTIDSAARSARVRAVWADPVQRAARIEAVRQGKRKGGAEQRARLSAAVRKGKRRAKELRFAVEGQASLF